MCPKIFSSLAPVGIPVLMFTHLSIIAIDSGLPRPTPA